MKTTFLSIIIVLVSCFCSFSQTNTYRNGNGEVIRFWEDSIFLVLNEYDAFATKSEYYGQFSIKRCLWKEYLCLKDNLIAQHSICVDTLSNGSIGTVSFAFLSLEDGSPVSFPFIRIIDNNHIIFEGIGSKDGTLLVPIEIGHNTNWSIQMESLAYSMDLVISVTGGKGFLFKGPYYQPISSQKWIPIKRGSNTFCIWHSSSLFGKKEWHCLDRE